MKPRRFSSASFAALLAAFCTVSTLSAQLLVWDVNGITASGGSLAGTPGTGISSGTLSLSPEVSTSSAANTFGASGFDQTSLAAAIADGDYLAFSIAPITGFEFSLTSIAVNLGIGVSTEFRAALFSSATGGFTEAAQLWTFSFESITPASQTIDLATVDALQRVTEQTDFRIYGWRNSTGTSTFRIRNLSGNDLTIFGSSQVSAVPEPSTYVAIFGGLSLIGALIYRRQRQQA